MREYYNLIILINIGKTQRYSITIGLDKEKQQMLIFKKLETE